RTTWFYRVDLGRDEVTGKRMQMSQGGFRTRQAAQRALREKIREIEDGTYVAPSKMTLSEYLEEWKEDYVAHNVRPSTGAEYRRIIDRYIVPQLGNYRIQDLRARHIQGYLSLMLKSGRIRGTGGLSASTVRSHFRVLSEALKYAKDMDIIKSKPAARVKPPKVEAFEPVIVTAEIARKILDEAVGTPWLAAFCLAFYTGIRRSELCGLRWSDVDLEKYCLTIDTARVAVKGGSAEGKPKSKSSRRLVSLSHDVLWVLSRHRENQMHMFEALGIPWTEDIFLFCNDRGIAYHPSSFSHAFKRMARKAGYPDVRLHDTRHAHATILLGTEVHPKVVQKRLGHSTIATTMDIYSHVLREMDVSAAEAFDRQFDDAGAQIGAQKRKSSRKQRQNSIAGA
ncbi:MAG: tyrosine-type recombinase/integrase, partial [Dehalococcoidia bacterium]|nr:tyrosine-type recombinase/integrase [Dehalococcoidia bacterium]